MLETLRNIFFGENYFEINPVSSWDNAIKKLYGVGTQKKILLIYRFWWKYTFNTKYIIPNW